MASGIGHVSLTLEGIESMDRRLEGLGEPLLRKVAKGLNERLEAIMTRSKDEFVPIDTGHLKNTGYVTVEQDGVSIKAAMGYSAEYAAAVHEIDKNYRNGRQWKYLETPFKEGLPDVMNGIKDDTQSAIRSVTQGLFY